MAPVRKKPHARRRHFLREWREFRELSQEAAADRTDISRSLLSKIEAGKVPYNQDLLERLAVAYRCEPEDLITINPGFWDAPRIVYNQLRQASPSEQRQAVDILKALLKTGS